METILQNPPGSSSQATLRYDWWMCLKHQLDAGRDWFSPDIASWHTCAWIRLIGWHSWRDSQRKRGRRKTSWSDPMRRGDRCPAHCKPLCAISHFKGVVTYVQNARFNALYVHCFLDTRGVRDKEINNGTLHSHLVSVAAWDLEVAGLCSCCALRQTAWAGRNTCTVITHTHKCTQTLKHTHKLLSVLRISEIWSTWSTFYKTTSTVSIFPSTKAATEAEKLLWLRSTFICCFF